MALRNSTDGALLGYSAAIASAISNDDDALLDLVEEFMRDRTGGTLYALSRPEFVYLARESLDDVLAWHRAGAVNDMTLTHYCAVLGLTFRPASTSRLRRDDHRVNEPAGTSAARPGRGRDRVAVMPAPATRHP